MITTQLYQPSWSIDNYSKTSLEPDVAPLQPIPVLVSANDQDKKFWHEGERIHHLFEGRCDGFGWRGSRKKIAVEYPEESYSYTALDSLANRIARYLDRLGVQTGERIGLLFDRSIYSHAAVLAVSKLNAAYVPLDAGFPVDRIDYMLKDSRVSIVLTLSQFTAIFDSMNVKTVALDVHREAINKMRAKRLPSTRAEASGDGLCYIIYTSGSTGRPKGVPIMHSSICNFLRVASRTYGYAKNDRVYQGMTIAFDYSFEELWVPLVTGATLVPAPSDGNLIGSDLADFLITRRITALCCVPTLLATVEDDLPKLRFLMVSGEACPQNLANRWHRPGRRFLNTYGPTETTVSATWLVFKPGAAVTIGGPLPAYSILILSPDEPEALAQGETGEICIAGIGLADGYLNLPEQTDNTFIEDFVGIKNNPSGKIYRTGDLGRINEQHQIEYLGRIDTQVKIRGYRIELDEIESVVMDIKGIAQAVITPCELEPGNVELAAYVTLRAGADPLEPTKIQNALRERLPSYMIPAFYEVLDELPVLPSGKVDRKQLPEPIGSRLLLSGKMYVAPQPGIETDLAELLAGLLKVERVSADDDFFDDLGANSLLIAQYVTRVRKTLGVKRVSLKQIYQNPTVTDLASTLASVATIQTKRAKAPETSPVEPVLVDNARLGTAMSENAAATNDIVNNLSTNDPLPDTASRATAALDKTKPGKAAPRVASYFEYVTCGVLQTAFYIAEIFFMAYVGIAGLIWITAADTAVEVYLRTVGFGVVFFVGLAAFLIAVKWIAIGRFKAERIPIWSLRYVRFWIARSAIRMNPLNLTQGTPLYRWYLRLLGARVGRRTTIFATPPICTDLTTIGDDTIIRESAVMTGYTAQSGYLYLGGVTIGSRAYVGEATVLDINSSVGNDAQLGTSSALYENQSVPDGKIYQGSPAEESQINFDRVPACNFGAFRRALYVVYLLLSNLLGTFPIVVMALYLIFNNSLNDIGSSLEAFIGLMTTIRLLGYSAVLHFGGIVLALAGVLIIPRLLNLFVKPDVAYPLYSPQYYLARAMTTFSNSKLLNLIFGDSSMIVYYLSAIGYDLSEATQTGSNFGVEQRHNSPFLCKFGRNTLVSDSLTLMNMEISNTSFRMSQISVPADTYLGNNLYYPVGAQVGENCLIATKAMVPIDGPRREGVGILGSPPFEIPRSVMRDRKFDHYKKPAVLKQRLRMKLRSNLVTLALYLFKSWTELFLLMMVAWGEAVLYSTAAFSSIIDTAAFITSYALIVLLFHISYSILFEHISLSFRRLKPLYCSLYDLAFWKHERYWKMSELEILELFNGTPMKPFFQRLRRMRIGRKVFDDGAAFTEPSLVEIGDNCCFNVGSEAQSHSLEDGTFKSDYIRIGSGFTLGVGALVHYDTRILDNVILLTDSFLMKGTEIEHGATWCGNPAREKKPPC